jgi:hypothetical protein
MMWASKRGNNFRESVDCFVERLHWSLLTAPRCPFRYVPVTSFTGIAFRGKPASSRWAYCRGSLVAYRRAQRSRGGGDDTQHPRALRYVNCIATTGGGPAHHGGSCLGSIGAQSWLSSNSSCVRLSGYWAADMKGRCYLVSFGGRHAKTGG